MQVAVLFARADSNYKQLPECDVWDAERDARKWPGGCPVVAHPPCRAWGRLRHFAKPRDDEKDLARDHIATWSNPGDLVLDPFSGSGTTAKAAKTLGRQFIGLEVNPEYCRIAEQRIAQEVLARA